MARIPAHRLSKRAMPAKSRARTLTGKPASASVSGKEMDELFGRTSLTRIDRQAKDGRYFSGEELAAAIEANPGQPLPQNMRDYLCRLLRGQVKKKPGPQKKPLSYNAILNDVFDEVVLPLIYQEELQRFKDMRKAHGRRIKGEPAPHEQAAESIKNRFKRFAMITPRRLANILSSRKSGR